MPDNPKKTGSADSQRINVNQSHELSYWTKKWGIMDAVLKSAVDAVGVMATDVEKWLREKKHI